MVDLDIELVVGRAAGSGCDPVVIDGWIGHVRGRLREQAHQLLGDGIDQVAGGAG